MEIENLLGTTGTTTTGRVIGREKTVGIPPIGRGMNGINQSGITRMTGGMRLMRTTERTMDIATNRGRNRDGSDRK
jgi:hypothetical protein